MEAVTQILSFIESGNWTRFEYLKKKEGFLLYILHSGGRDIRPEISGNLKDGDDTPSKVSDSNWKGLIGLGVVLGIMIGVAYPVGDIEPFWLQLLAVLLIWGTLILASIFAGKWLKRKAGDKLDSLYEAEFSPNDFS